MDGKLNSPYGYMTVGAEKFYNGHRIKARKLMEFGDMRIPGHQVPEHWIASAPEYQEDS